MLDAREKDVSRRADELGGLAIRLNNLATRVTTDLAAPAADLSRSLSNVVDQIRELK